MNREARLSAVERDILATLGAAMHTQRGRTLALTNAEIAESIAAPLRTTERALARLRKRQFISTAHRGRRGGVIVVHDAAIPHTTGSRPTPVDIDVASSPARGQHLRYGKVDVVIPDGFLGDRDAFITATLLRGRGEKKKPTTTFAERYLERASGAELARLENLKDDRGLYPIYVNPTGDVDLDEGLRLLVEAQARRDRMREMLLSQHPPNPH